MDVILLNRAKEILSAFGEMKRGALDALGAVAVAHARAAVPTLENTNALTNIAADCEIRVPAALADEWKASGYWGYMEKYIVVV